MTRTAKGKRPIYLNNPENDQLLAMLMKLVSEVSVLRDRLDTIERLAQAKGLISREEIESYEPDDPVALERDKWRAEYIERVLRVWEEGKE